MYGVGVVGLISLESELVQFIASLLLHVFKDRLSTALCVCDCVRMHAKLAAGWLGVKARQTCTEAAATLEITFLLLQTAVKKKVYLCFVFTWNLMVHLSA
jgi:hypothetical protein